MPEIVFFAIVGLVFLLAVINAVKKQKSFEKESFYWVIASIAMLVLAINPHIIIKISEIVSVRYPPSVLFLIAILFIFYLLFKITSQFSNFREQNKELAQEIIILKAKLKKLEKEAGEKIIDIKENEEKVIEINEIEDKNGQAV